MTKSTSTKGLLEPYVGVLTIAEIVEGMNAAEQNAVRLLRDAELLLSAERYPSATAVAILSIEESGKVTVLRDLSTAPDADEVKRVWRDFRSHTKKNRTWIFPELILKGVGTNSLYAKLFDPDSDHPALLDALKQVAIYTDCLAKRHWAKPWEAATQSLASTMVENARVFARDKQYSVEHIELWVQYIGPARKMGASGAIIDAFLRWEQQANTTRMGNGVSSEADDERSAFTSAPSPTGGTGPM